MKTRAPGEAAVRLDAALAVALAACVAGAAAAAQELPRGLVLASTLERLGAAGGGDAAASDTAAPLADQLVVSVRLTNASGDTIDSVRVTSAVPAGVQYVPQSASGPGSEVLFSVDHGRSFGRPGELTLAAPDGGVRAASASDYTHVRWVLRAPLDAGATGVVRFRAVPR